MRAGLLTTKAIGSPGGVAPLDAGGKVPIGNLPPSSGGGDASYTHYQSSPSSLWTVTHSLGKIPAVSILDSAGTVYLAEIKHLDANSFTVSLGQSMTGRAVCN